MTLADQIREHLGPAAGRNTHTALLAVVNKGEQMRAESARHPGGIGHIFADEFLTVIARELGINPEETSC